MDKKGILIVEKDSTDREVIATVVDQLGYPYDIGKIGIRDDVLLTNGPFTPKEREEMNTHPLKTKDHLEKFRFPKLMRSIPEIALYHHEKVNGQGYPMGLTGEKIPLESKIMAERGRE